MAENENRTVWPVTLYQNQMTERTDDYSARVKTFDDTKDLEYVVNEVIADGTEFKKQTLIDIYTRIEAKIRALVRQGYPVQTDNVRFGPSVEGSFSGEGLPLEDSEIKCTLNLKCEVFIYLNLISQIIKNIVIICNLNLIFFCP